MYSILVENYLKAESAFVYFVYFFMEYLVFQIILIDVEELQK